MRVTDKYVFFWKTLAQIVKIIKDSDSLCNRPDDYYINRIEEKWKDESNR